MSLTTVNFPGAMKVRGQPVLGDVLEASADSRRGHSTFGADSLQPGQRYNHRRAPALDRSSSSLLVCGMPEEWSVIT